MKALKKFSIHIIIVLFLIIYTVLVEKHYTLRIIDFGPKQTLAGKLFNIQANGKSAVWFKTKGILTKNVNLKWDELTLKAKVNFEKRLVSAQIPGELFEKEGRHILFLIDKKDFNSSNKVVFNVK